MSQTHNRTLIIVILGALSTISPFAIDMYLPAFPEIAAALHTSTAKVSLSLASYFAGLAAGQLFYGPLLDRFGRKLPLYAGLTLFIAASVLCLFSRSVETLVAMRFVQAFLYHKGGEFVMRSSGDAGVCSRAVAQVKLTGEPTVEIPCMGDRRFAMAQDHEMIVGIPYTWLNRAAQGLAATHKAGIRYPVPFQIPSECDLPPDYITCDQDR